MKTKFIEGTNKQYSITVEGQVTRHYRKNYDINKKEIVTLYNNIILTPDSRNTVRVSHKAITIPKLLRKVFGFNYCSNCNDKIDDNSTGKRTRQLCNDCLKRNQEDYNRKTYLKRRVLSTRILLTDKQKIINHQKSRDNWILNNPEKYKKKIIKFNKLKVENINKSYVADCLKMPVLLIHGTLYDAKRNQLKLHRELKKQKQNDNNK